MIYGYARVSTKSQQDNTSFETQKQEILKAASLEQLKLYSEDKNIITYEETISGTTHPFEREKFQKLFNRLTEKDVLIVSKLDRLARNPYFAREVMDELNRKKIRFIILDLPFLSTLNDPEMSKLIVAIFGAFAEYERIKIHERMENGRKEALKRAIENGEKSPFGRPKKFKATQLDYAISLLDKMSYERVAKETGISKSTLIREVKHRRALELQTNS